MPVGPSKVSIWNLALSHIGQRSVTSDQENSVQALQCRRVWDLTRQEALRKHDWGFCTNISALSELTNFTPVNWAYGYQYPVRALTIWHVYSQAEASALTIDNDDPTGTTTITTKSNGVPFRVVYDPTLNTKVIVTNLQDAYAEISYDVEDTTLYDAAFATCVSFLLASYCAYPLTGDKDLALNMIKLFNAALSEAERFSTIETRTDQHGNGTIVDSRG